MDAEVEKEVKKEERIVKDLKTLSQKEKLKLLKKESPELLELIQDFKAKVEACTNDICYQGLSLNSVNAMLN